MNKFYVFIWAEYEGHKGRVLYRPLCGGDQIRAIDNGLRGLSLSVQAREKAQEVRVFRPEVIGYSVGYLTSHDPDNGQAQAVRPFCHFEKGYILPG